MKLIRCKIDNFGKLQNFSLDFDAKQSVFLEENAWGKSTLAAFIRVMFYGFEGESKKALSDREREKYRPWEKGVYGGSIAFEADGMAYELQKSFGAKEKDDTGALYDLSTNLPSNDYDVFGIGEALFEIDAKSFMRTVFIAQNDVTVNAEGKNGVEDGISAKIGNLTDATDDVNQYDKVRQSLTDILNKLTPKKATGLLKKLDLEIGDLQQKLRNKSVLEETVAQVEKRLETEREEKKSRQEKLHALDLEYEKAGVYQELQLKKKQYEALLKKRDEAECELDTLRKAFPGELPKKQEMDEMLVRGREVDLLQARIRDGSLNGSETERKENLARIFAAGVPAREQLADYKKKAHRFLDLKDKVLQSRLSDAEKAGLEELKRCYPKGVAGKEEIEQHLQAWKEHNRLVVDVPARELRAELLKSDYEKKSGQKKMARITGVILLVLGIGLFVLLQEWMSLAGFVVAAFLMFLIPSVMKMPCTGAELETALTEVMEDHDRLEQAENEVLVFLEHYDAGCSLEKIEDALYTMRRESGEYEFLMEKETRYREQGYEEEMQEIATAMSGFVHGIHPELELNERNVMELVLYIESEAAEYQSLCERWEKAVQLQKDAEEKRERIIAFLEKCGLKAGEDLTSQLQDTEKNLMAHKHGESTYKAAVLEAETYAKEHGLEESPMQMETKDGQETGGLQSNKDGDASDKSAPARSTEEILEEKRICTEEIEKSEDMIRSYTKQLEDYEEELLTLTEAEVRLEELTEKRVENAHRYEIIGHTRDYLQEAKEKLTARYLEPIKTSFGKYYSILTGGDAEDFTLDANINLTKEEAGGRREIKSLSSGWQDLIQVCLRMALVDVMYTEEKPFLVLDDPFVNLDEKKLQRVKAFLQEVSKEYQILYFTCHESRV